MNKEKDTFGELTLVPKEGEAEEENIFGDFSARDKAPGDVPVDPEKNPATEEQAQDQTRESVFGVRPSAFKRKAARDGYTLEPLKGKKASASVTNFVAEDRKGEDRRRLKDRRKSLRMTEDRRSRQGRRN